MSQTPLPAGATPASPVAPPSALARPESAPLDPELVLEPPELALAPPELELALELAIVPPELELVPLEPVPPGLELAPPELAPLDSELAPPESVPALELPFVGPPFVGPPFDGAPGEVPLEPLEQPPAAETATNAPAREAAGPKKATRQEKWVVFPTFTSKPYCAHASRATGSGESMQGARWDCRRGRNVREDERFQVRSPEGGGRLWCPR